MDPTEQSRGGLEDAPFSWRENREGKVFISWRGSQVMILKGQQATSFLRRIKTLNEAERQLAMAKVTGNFKRGNER